MKDATRSSLAEALRLLFLAEALPKEIERVRNEILPVWEELPPESRAVGVLLIKNDLKYAEDMTAEHDTVGMLYAHKRLVGWRL
jgi:hypothetical protein